MFSTTFDLNLVHCSARVNSIAILLIVSLRYYCGFFVFVLVLPHHVLLRYRIWVCFLSRFSKQFDSIDKLPQALKTLKFKGRQQTDILKALDFVADTHDFRSEATKLVLIFGAEEREVLHSHFQKPLDFLFWIIKRNLFYSIVWEICGPRTNSCLFILETAIAFQFQIHLFIYWQRSIPNDSLIYNSCEVLIRTIQHELDCLFELSIFLQFIQTHESGI